MTSQYHNLSPLKKPRARREFTNESQLASALRDFEAAEDAVWLQAATLAIEIKSERKKLPKRVAELLQGLSDYRYHALLELFDLEVSKR